MIFRPLENPLRIKITGKCNRNCFFCHREGGMDIDDIIIDCKWKSSIEEIGAVFGIHSVAITGGEPFCHEDIIPVLDGLSLCKGIDRLSLTTNGTIEKDYHFWCEAKSYGLYKVNISMPDLLTSVNSLGEIDLVKSPFSVQMRMIDNLNEAGIRVKINCAVFHDYFYTTAVLKSLLSLDNVDIVLLPNISDQKTFDYSWQVIEKILREFRFTRLGIRRRFHTSDTLLKYENEIGQKLDIKTTKFDDFCFEGLCTNCQIKNQCQEGFYGIRMEQKNGEPYVRLCLHRSDNEVLMPVDMFMKNDIRFKLEALWKQKG